MINKYAKDLFMVLNIERQILVIIFDRIGYADTK